MGLEEEEKKAKKGAAVLGRGWGWGGDTFPCLQRKLQGPLAGEVAILDPRILRPERTGGVLRF